MKCRVGSARFRGGTRQKPYTDKQGQYLAFIHYYHKIHGRAPAEADMQQYFRVSPPSVHPMVLTLATRGLIERTPGQARSIRLLIPPEELPDLA
jgi:SOS-response transcriptional repressor LexA